LQLYKNGKPIQQYGVTKMNIFIVCTALFAAAVHAAVNHVVQVAPGNTLSYNPSSLTAAPGDTVEFDFMANVRKRLEDLG
jgi:plastocyanin